MLNAATIIKVEPHSSQLIALRNKTGLEDKQNVARLFFYVPKYNEIIMRGSWHAAKIWSLYSKYRRN